MKKFFITTHHRCEIIDITDELKNFIRAQSHPNGILVVYSPHTTAGITINENADPDVKSDINSFLSKLIPHSSGFTHAEGNSDAHIKGSLINFSQTFIVAEHSIQLGTWQGIFFIEFDGPRRREYWAQFITTSS